MQPRERTALLKELKRLEVPVVSAAPGKLRAHYTDEPSYKPSKDITCIGLARRADNSIRRADLHMRQITKGKKT
jgi:hypothetical protein